MPERKRSYKMGSRRPDLGKNDGLMSPNRWAWVKNTLGQFVIMVDDDDENPDHLLGRTIRLFHPIPKRPPVSWNLTALTHEELVTLREIITSALDWAEPIVIARDQEAQRAFEDGDDSHARIYRQVPQLVYRKRPEQEHGQSVQHRPEDAPAVGETGDDPAGGASADGSDVAEPDEGRVEPEDNWPTPHQPPGVREVGGGADTPE